MIRLSVSASRKVPGHQSFSSDGYHAELSVELPDSLLGDVDTVRQKLAGLFLEARSAVDAQVDGNGSQHTPDPNVDLRNRIEHAVNSSGNGSNGTETGNGSPGGRGDGQQPATSKQLGFIRSLAKRQQIDRQQLDQLVTQLTGCKGLGDNMSKVDASLVIEELNS